MIGYCGFCENLSDTDLDKIYHDNEWGIPVHDDRKMFEYITKFGYFSITNFAESGNSCQNKNYYDWIVFEKYLS